MTDDGVCRAASLPDLFATKLNTVYQRAEAKDYLDIRAILLTGFSRNQPQPSQTPGPQVQRDSAIANGQLVEVALQEIGPQRPRIARHTYLQRAGLTADFPEPKNRAAIASFVRGLETRGDGAPGINRDSR
jgi:hypothetical protein